MLDILNKESFDFFRVDCLTKAILGRLPLSDYACFRPMCRLFSSEPSYRGPMKPCGSGIVLAILDNVTRSISSTDDRSKIDPDQHFASWYFKELQNMGFDFQWQYQGDDVQQAWGHPDVTWRVVLDTGKYPAKELFVLYVAIRFLWEYPAIAATYYVLRGKHPDIDPFKLMLLSHVNVVHSGNTSHHSLWEGAGDHLAFDSLQELQEEWRKESVMDKFPVYSSLEGKEAVYYSFAAKFWSCHFPNDRLKMNVRYDPNRIYYQLSSQTMVNTNRVLF